MILTVENQVFRISLNAESQNGVNIEWPGQSMRYNSCNSLPLTDCYLAWVLLSLTRFCFVHHQHHRQLNHLGSQYHSHYNQTLSAGCDSEQACLVLASDRRPTVKLRLSYYSQAPASCNQNKFAEVLERFAVIKFSIMMRLSEDGGVSKSAMQPYRKAF